MAYTRGYSCKRKRSTVPSGCVTTSASSVWSALGLLSSSILTFTLLLGCLTEVDAISPLWAGRTPVVRLHRHERDVAEHRPGDQRADAGKISPASPTHCPRCKDHARGFLRLSRSRSTAIA